MTGMLESNVYGLWVSAQKDKATAATLAVKRLIQTGGDVDVNRDDGSENYSDSSRWGTQTDFVNTIAGSGNPVIECQANELAYLLWLFFGTEVFSVKVPATSPPKFVFTPSASNATGLWSTWWKSVGLSTVLRQKFNACKIQSVRLEASTANKVMKITPTFVSTDPGEIFTADPVIVHGTQQPFVYTDGAAAFKIDGAVYRGHSQFAIVLNDNTAAFYGDDVTASDVVASGTPEVTLEGITIALDDQELARFNTQIYGTASPIAGAKPLKSVLSTLGAWEATLTKTNADLGLVERCKLEVPGVKWSPALATAPNPDGGHTEHALAGQMRKNGVNPEVRVTVETGGGDNLAHALPA